ncbi:betaine/proline/choline family ABC transporter ATP-binding protein [Blastococcus sp. TML/M2B]|uniref:quaternary amine ABC transporter ATP-binding protein n=1 Tax=unclassified Blastococcus TaxID=2619396 RepID=UPI00190B3DD1|nr:MULTISPECIES: betaine/proline/choline family ABC transporter ATP-binding protein [unclassified Blastococcus]MBN1092712.1 betaine/proline/choline family ABC transporter ATP-binding protein [Blastococcus sp. TML/M2B]MBN1097175.1 betaine/proline/choline family ABC transporter ATP-binding protein [Blastococcus sp. TML/C7B]
MTALRVDGLFKVFGRYPAGAVERLRAGATADEIRASGATPAVIDVDLAVEPGEIFVVMGLSGSGKSTLLRMLNGLLEPTAGTVTVGGDEITALSGKRLREVRQRRISMVFQHLALLPHRSVVDNAAYALEVRGVERRTRLAAAREALSMVGLDGQADKRPDQLSGGMQQRVGLARALASEAEVLLMDEAFSALDPLIRREMQDQLLELQARLGKTIVFITHDLNEAMRLGDRIAIMRDGRIVRLGTPESILADPGDEYVERFLADVDRARVFTAADVAVPTASPDVPPAGRVPADTPLTELLGPVSASEAPIAVVDDAGRTIGLVDARAVLAALAGRPSDDRAAAPLADRAGLLEGSRG